MVEVVSIDTSGLNRALQGLHHALIGAGQDGALTTFVRTEARQWSLEISKQLGPKTLEKAANRVRSDVKKVFHPAANSKTGEDYDLFEGRQAGDGAIRWLYAGPTYLVGIREDDFVPGLATDQMQTIYNNYRGTERGRAWQDQGENLGMSVRPTKDGKLIKRVRYAASRGKQHAILLNRLLVKKEQFREFTRKLIGRIGRLRATFAYTAFLLGAQNIPNWVKKHFDRVSADGAAIFDMSKMAAENPEISFGSRAPGVNTNPYIAGKIQSSAKSRERIAYAKLKKVLQGYVYDFNTGQVYRQHAKEQSFSE